MTPDIPISPAIFLIDVAEQLANEDVMSYIQTFDKNIRNSLNFGCIIRYQGGMPKKSKEAHRMENDWLREHKSQMTQYCFGIALLANPGIMALVQKIAMKGFGQNFFGCPCDVFYDEEAARTWLLGQQVAKMKATGLDSADESA